MQEYTSLVSHRGELYALTKEGLIYRIFIDELTHKIDHAMLLYSLPEIRRY